MRKKSAKRILPLLLVAVASAAGVDAAERDVEADSGTFVATDTDAEGTYVLNTNSMKFHLPDCEGAAEISARNREEYTGSARP